MSSRFPSRNAAGRAAYGVTLDEDILAFRLQLNPAFAAQEARGEAITPPGLPGGLSRTRNAGDGSLHPTVCDLK